MYTGVNHSGGWRMAPALVRIVFLFVCIILLGGCSPSGGKTIEFFPGTFQAAFQEARATGKKVFVLVVNAECTACDPFIAFLNAQPATVAKLQDDYISVEVHEGDPAGKRFFQLTKCPAYPFPYFFDAEGNLEAFGFPDTQRYDISDLRAITYDDTQFRERFKMDIDTDSYKKMVSSALRAYLLQYKRTLTSDEARQALTWTQESLQIAQYPFNLCLAYRLAQQAGDDAKAQQYFDTYQRVYTVGDEELYYGLISSSGVSL